MVSRERLAGAEARIRELEKALEDADKDMDGLCRAFVRQGKGREEAARLQGEVERMRRLLEEAYANYNRSWSLFLASGRNVPDPWRGCRIPGGSLPSETSRRMLRILDTRL